MCISPSSLANTCDKEGKSWDLYVTIALGLKNLPLIHSYDSIQALNKSINKSERGHDLVIAVSCILLDLFLVNFPELSVFSLGMNIWSSMFVFNKWFFKSLHLRKLSSYVAFPWYWLMVNVCCSGVKSYVLGEIPSLKDRITIVRQLWDLTRDVLVWFLAYGMSCLVTCMHCTEILMMLHYW